MKPYFTMLFLASCMVLCAKKMSAQIFLGCDSMDINNIGGRINVLGDNFTNPGKGVTAFQAPIGTNLSTIYASSLWIGGYEKGKMRVAAMTYRQSGIDFFPGPLDTVTDSINPATMSAYNQVWKVKRTEINDFLNTQTVSPGIKNWPGNGIPGVNAGNSAVQLAPYVDVNNDMKYDPADGDYPKINGDEAIWWVMNDKGGAHGETKGKALGIEVQGQAYAFDMPSDDAINNTIFLDYKIINRSQNEIDSVYLGIWTDFDIGYAFDDYIGSAPNLSAYFGYNGEPVDPFYGSNTPVESVIFLKDSLSRFLYYDNTASSINGNPGYPVPTPQDYYNYLKGVWKNGACMKYGSKDGVSGTQCFDFMFDGPASDTVSGWTEHNVDNIPGDRRGLGSAGPLTLKPGQTIDFPLAYVFARVPNGNTVTNYQATDQYWAEIKKFYNSNYTVSGIDNGTPQTGSLILYPNPAMDHVYIHTANGTIQKTVIMDMTGRTVYCNANMGNDSHANIDISGLAGGVYTVTVTTRNGSASQKLVVAR